MAQKTPKKKKSGRLLTVLCVLVILVGLGIAAYPFLITTYMNAQKDAVVRELEAVITIPDESAYEGINVEALPEYDTPHYSRAEKQASANALGLLDTLFANPSGGQQNAAPSGEGTLSISPDAQGGDILSTEAGMNASGLSRPSTNEGPSLVVGGESSTTEGGAISPALNQTPAPGATPAPRATIDPNTFLVSAFDDDDSVLGSDSGSIVDVGTQQTPSPKSTPNYSMGYADIYFSSQDAEVTFEEYSTMETRALAMSEALFGKEVRYPNRRVNDDLIMSYQSIQTRITLIKNLLSIFDGLSSTGTSVVRFPTGEEVLVSDALGVMRTVTETLDKALLQGYALAPDKELLTLVNSSLDETVALCDTMQDFADYMSTFLAPGDANAYANTRTNYTVAQTEAQYLLDIPSIDLRIGCFPNATFEDLYVTMRKGASLFPRVGLPNTNTNITMSAHRTGTTAFFNRLNEVAIGDTLYLHTRTIGSYRYVVETVTVVEAEDWSVAENGKGYPTITLLSCEEFGGTRNARRICVQARLDGIAR